MISKGDLGQYISLFKQGNNIIWYQNSLLLWLSHRRRSVGYVIWQVGTHSSIAQTNASLRQLYYKLQLSRFKFSMWSYGIRNTRQEECGHDAEYKQMKGGIHWSGQLVRHNVYTPIRDEKIKTNILKLVTLFKYDVLASRLFRFKQTKEYMYISKIDNKQTWNKKKQLQRTVQIINGYPFKQAFVIYLVCIICLQCRGNQ